MKTKMRAELEAFADQAEKALRDAVKWVIEEHRRSGKPLAMMRGGKTVLVPPDQVAMRLPVVAEMLVEHRLRRHAGKPKQSHAARSEKRPEYDRSPRSSLSGVLLRRLQAHH